MKFVLPILLGFIFSFSCSSKPRDTDKLIDGGAIMNSTTLDTCFCEELVKDSTEFLFLEDVKFTGVCVHNYPNSTEKYIVKNILEGKLHGSVIYYAVSGEELMKENYKSGELVRAGEENEIVCDCSELNHVDQKNRADLPKKTYLDGTLFTGTCYKYYPESTQRYIDIAYKNGFQEGYSIYYDREGKTMYIEKYEAGTLTQTLDQH